MAHHKSAEKRIRQTVVRTARNRANTSRLKTAVKNAEEAIASGNKAAAEAALKAAQPELARGVGKSMGEFKKARDDFEREITRAENEVRVKDAPGKESQDS